MKYSRQNASILVKSYLEQVYFNITGKALVQRGAALVKRHLVLARTQHGVICFNILSNIELVSVLHLLAVISSTLGS